ncbi:MotA/TolQ/ExbB proton channel family protein [Candidatus Nitrospira neomarina]|uniref:MotA/TolQ/ExbB proton channel family protein n=1 Tax=Candidatus Nitrospira neomarina TaxID=3020899 RepID=A0AA96GHH5_9BACT|nr:MotA/TolQ/ExbB proton channel family protein [Candidatus Nitrospira neomarina]WNM61986.1 MotA/TolQ/ExbB proton channel family protein [Candidatus Nitrospira neomarina]
MIQILIKGGWMMIPILGCSLLALTITIERGLKFRSLRFSRLADRIIKLAGQGKWSDALAVAEQRQSPTLRVLAAGIFHRAKQPDKAMEAAGIAEVSQLKRGLSILDTVITLGPLLGLLGTIIGMISSFGIMAETGLGNPHAVTGGVAEALICTAAGICVAVITLIPYNYFLSQVEQETERIEQYATQLQTTLQESTAPDS